MLLPEYWRQIEELYHAAKSCPPNQRAALLEGTEPEIRERVERILEVESSGGMLDQSPVTLLRDRSDTVVRRAGAQCGAPLEGAYRRR